MLNFLGGNQKVPFCVHRIESQLFMADFPGLQGILSSVYLDGKALHGWKMYSIPFHNLNEVPKINPIIQVASSGSVQQSARKKLEHKHGMSLEPFEKVERCSIIFVALFSLLFLVLQSTVTLCSSYHLDRDHFKRTCILCWPFQY